MFPNYTSCTLQARQLFAVIPDIHDFCVFQFEYYVIFNGKREFRDRHSSFSIFFVAYIRNQS